jgi:hypothetical protein
MDFWDVHGIIFLIAITLIPRITLLVSIFLFNMVSGGLLWWLGFIIAPHLLVAILATSIYWDTNPILCIISWFVALAGTSTEASVVNNQ